MNLPNKTKVSKHNNVFIQDENGKNLLIASAWISEDYQKDVMNAMCKRYNRYNKLVIALVVVSTLLLFAVMTIVQLIRFKLV